MSKTFGTTVGCFCSKRALKMAFAASLSAAMLSSCDSGQTSIPTVRNQQEAAPADAKPAFTVPAGESGFYTLTASRLQIGDDQVGEVELRVSARHAAIADASQPEPAVVTRLRAGELFDFDTFLGYLAAGDTIHVSLTADGGKISEKTLTKYKAERAPAIPVSVFPEDIANPGAVDAPGGWCLMADIAAGQPSARLVGWNDTSTKGIELRGDKASLQLSGKAGRESIAAFRVPQSGYYALHNASATAGADGVEARVYAGRQARPQSVTKLASGKPVNLDTELGYVEKGDVVYVALASSEPATVELSATVVEWTPRRPPLRVRRGSDGLLNVFEPADPRRAIDIPADRWITVTAQEGDATEAIRKAFADAAALQKGEEYAGVRLEQGKEYVLASNQATGVIFDIKDRSRLVFDGNGATLLSKSPEAQREGIRLFTTSGDTRKIALADFAVETSTYAFSVGEVIAVGPMEKGDQTITFRTEPGQPDPIKDIRRNGMSEGYAYDPQIPGRPAFGAWSHFPGGNVTPNLKATDEPGVFTHTVTRTNQSIPVGSKWLVKVKRGGVHILSTGGNSEDITLSGVDGRGSIAGMLTFWGCSGVNILDCRFEPQDQYWISSSSDGVHGRGREGVWIENTLIRGICEDVMNTYGVSTVVVADDNPDDNVMTFGLFDAGRRDKDGYFVLSRVGAGHALVGDELTFFNAKEGRVLGYATVVENDGAGRMVLSNPVPGVDTWEKTDGKAATMVYNNRLAARFFVRDSRIMDSMRFGIFIKARGGAVFNTHFEGLADQAIFAANEPEWPEGPPPTHLWLQGNTFYHNDYGYCGRNRAFLTVDPAQVSIYTRRLRDPSVPPGFAAHITRGQYPNTHMKIVGNTFGDWRGTAISVRNARNLQITDNLFLPPAEDSVMRTTLAKDPAMSNGGTGRYAAVFMDSVVGGRVANNRFVGLPEGDQDIVHDQDVRNVVEDGNAVGTVGSATPAVDLSFSEWFGPSAAETGTAGSVQDSVELRGATHVVGRMGAGLAFGGKDDHALLRASADLLGKPLQQMTLAFWARPAAGGQSEQVMYSHGNAGQGVVIAINEGRFVAGLWQSGKGTWLDLGAAVPGVWQHIALVYDGGSGSLRGFVDGMVVSSTTSGVPSQLEAISTDAALGRAVAGTRLGSDRVISGNASYSGVLDEFRLLNSVEVDLGVLAMRRPATTR